GRQDGDERPPSPARERRTKHGRSTGKRGTALSAGGCISREPSGGRCRPVRSCRTQLPAASWGVCELTVNRNDHLEPACAPGSTAEGAALLVGEGGSKTAQIGEQADLAGSPFG